MDVCWDLVFCLKGLGGTFRCERNREQAVLCGGYVALEIVVAAPKYVAPVFELVWLKLSMLLPAMSAATNREAALCECEK